MANYNSIIISMDCLIICGNDMLFYGAEWQALFAQLIIFTISTRFENVLNKFINLFFFALCKIVLTFLNFLASQELRFSLVRVMTAIAH